MAETEPVRRSSRANKGRNARLYQEEQELLEEALRMAEKEAEVERLKAEEGHVLCITCGTTDNTYDEEEDERDMIQCDKCRTWQHNECVLANPKRVPKRYLCPLCDPENKYYKTLKYSMDPEDTRKWLEKDDLRKKKKQQRVQRMLEDLDELKKTGKMVQRSDEDSDDSDADGNHTSDTDNGSENGSDGIEDPLSDSEKRVKKERKEKKKKMTRSPEAKEEETKPFKRRKTATPPSSSLSSSISHEEIEQKARQAVIKRFEGMFANLLPDHKIPNEEGSAEEISSRWAVKLEEDLFDAHHDPGTGRLNKDYKEVSTRIFVNVKDKKNTKLRNSIINRHIPFNKLVRMPVNQLLNPDLRKEKEEAIKESMTQATLEKATVSNIRRTHKGDIVLENEDSVTGAPQFDFNVGMMVNDNDEKKFVQSDSKTTIKGHKSSIFDGDEIHNDDDDEDDDGNHESAKGSVYGNGYNDATSGDFKDEYDPETSVKTKFQSTLLDEEEDEDLAAILGETKKKIEEQVESYDPSAVNEGQKLWEGQTIFVGVTNFASTLHFAATTLTPASEFSIISHRMVDPVTPLEIGGRLDAKKAGDYLHKVSSSRKLVLLELKPQPGEERNFMKLFEYFNSKAKFGVVTSQQKFIKDSYLLPISERIPHFMRAFPALTFSSTQPRLFVVFVIRQEAIKTELNNDDYDPSAPVSNNNFDFLSALSANELALVQRIFEMYPRARDDPVFLIQQLQHMMNQ